MTDIEKTVERLQDHLKTLTQVIGERSVCFPENLEKTADYIKSFYQEISIPAQSQTYAYENFTAANIIAEVSFCPNPSKRYILGAHYDSVAGTAGADDNASAVAVQLETARALQNLKGNEKLDLSVKFVSFTLEEPPGFGTRHMGSRVYAKKARENKEHTDGMICLEMVGYTSQVQDYPFPLMYMGYPDEGNFIGIVGNPKSCGLTKSLFREFKKNPGLPVIKLTVPLSGWILPSVRLSDHSSFWDEGFKAVMVTDTAFFRNPHYHQASDTMDTLDFRFMAELTESLMLFFQSHKQP
ncbi:MAG: M28 family peptidase [Desulfobacterales bacterium]|nr:M28 family peptidase [Desulfobacterales bacterium]